MPHKKRAAMFTVKNAGDRATGLLHNQVALPLATGAGGVRTLADFQGFKLIGAARRRRDQGAARRAAARSPRRRRSSSPGSHGVKFKADDPAQREKQGAILCQDWPGFGPTTPEHLFTADDMPADANVHGLIHFLFACYGGGCPKEDNFGLATGKPPRPLIAEPIVARLPQRLLTKGALASLAHVDRAWAYSFQNSRSAPQVQEMRDVMVRLLKGQRVGQATDGFNMRWAVLGAELQESQNQREAFDRAAGVGRAAGQSLRRPQRRPQLHHHRRSRRAAADRRDGVVSRVPLVSSRRRAERPFAPGRAARGTDHPVGFVTAIGPAISQRSTDGNGSPS